MKTTPIKELMEKASKGPFFYHPEYSDNGASAGFNVFGDDGIFIVWVEHEANAQLIAHCLNNFPKLLEACGCLIDILSDMPCDIDEIEGVPEVLEALKEASEVQV